MVDDHQFVVKEKMTHLSVQADIMAVLFRQTVTVKHGPQVVVEIWQSETGVPVSEPAAGRKQLLGITAIT